MPKPNSERATQSLGSITAKIAAVTALLVATASPINTAIDVYRAVANVPTNTYDQTNDEMFKKHFGKQPLVVTQNIAGEKLMSLLV
jgi:hypothetical protein